MKTFKKLCSVLTAAALAMSLSILIPASAEESKPLFYSECEDLTLSSDVIVTDNIYGQYNTGYSGVGYAWFQSGGTISFEVEVPEDGMYNVSFRSMQYLSEEGREQFIYVNGKQASKFMMPYSQEWMDYCPGRVRMSKGVNTVEIKAGWGFACFDTVTVDFAEYPDLNIDPITSDSNATSETKSLMNYLCDVYGNNMLSGQQEIYGGGHDDQPDKYETEFEWIYNLSGEYPAIRGFDYMNYNPLYGWDDQTTERIIEWTNDRNGIPTVCWHINIPLDFTSYEIGDVVDWKEATYKPNSTFNTANAVIEGTKEHEYVMLTIKYLAEQLAILQENNVPVIFRPYHEAEGNPGQPWFWWGTGGPEAYKALWKQLYTELTETYNIHNLIWEFNSYNYSSSPEWYPGDDFVDIVAYDKYNTVYNRTDGLSNCPNEDAISDIFYNLVNLTDNKKLVAMSENDTVPSVDNMMVEKANWLYFCIWYDNGSENFLSGDNKNNPDTLKNIYQSDYCITLDELPDWKNYSSEPDINFTPGDVNSDNAVDIWDAVLIRRQILKLNDTQPEKSAFAADVNGDGILSIADQVIIQQYLVGKDVKLTYYKG